MDGMGFIHSLGRLKWIHGNRSVGQSVGLLEGERLNVYDSFYLFYVYLFFIFIVRTPDHSIITTYLWHVFLIYTP